MSEVIVSVVISTYNRSDQIGLSVGTVYAQNFDNLEVIVVDDASTDNTLEVLQTLQERYPRFQIIGNPINLGLARSLNKAIHAAKGKYIARIDDHDLWVNVNKLRLQVDVLEADPELGLIGTAFQEGKEIRYNPSDDKKIRKQILFRCPFCHVSTVFPKAVWQRAGGYSETIGYGEDWDLWLRIGRHFKFTNLTTNCVTVSQSRGLSNNQFLYQSKLGMKMVDKFGEVYPMSFIAKIYHRGVHAIFRFIKRDSIPHKMFHYIFSIVFLRK